MKILVVVILTVFISTFSYGQETPSKKMPPLSMLNGKLGEKKTIFELPDSMDYKIYNQKGKQITSGYAEFIDLTNFKKGTYFIIYSDQKIEFTKED